MPLVRSAPDPPLQRVKAVQEARESEEVREYSERADARPAEGFGSLADKLRGALRPKN